MHLRDGIQAHVTVKQRYDHLAETDAVRCDPAQERVVKALDHLLDTLGAKRLARKSSSLGWLFAKKPEAAAVKGLYIHGGVGRGKTMLMDHVLRTGRLCAASAASISTISWPKSHDRIQKHRLARKEGRNREDDPIPPVARAIAEETQLLCFDEFTVTDIADAMILSRLFSALFANGVVLVATSNVAPDDLYRDGLNRALFLPFIAILKRHADVIRPRFRYRLPDGEAQPDAGLHHAARRGGGAADGRGVGSDDAWPSRRAGGDRAERPRDRRAVGKRPGRAVPLRRPVRKAARRARLSGDRLTLLDLVRRQRSRPGRWQGATRPSDLSC